MTLLSALRTGVVAVAEMERTQPPDYVTIYFLSMFPAAAAAQLVPKAPCLVVPHLSYTQKNLAVTVAEPHMLGKLA